MDIIQMARDLGREIQKDERYLKIQLAMQAADHDPRLQGLIGQYNQRRAAMEAELQKQDRDQQKLQACNREMSGLYKAIMETPSMAAYNEAKDPMEELLRRVNAIIEQSANGADPDTADYVEHACSGECGACGGCH